MSTLFVDNLKPNLNTGVHIPGHIIQIINVENDTATSTSSTSFIPTNVTATITPKFATSKILVICQASVRQNTATSNGSSVRAQIHRGTTAIGQRTEVGTREIAGPNNTDYVQGAYLLQVLDSPNTTNSTTYTVYIDCLSSAVSATINHNTSGSSMTLMEVAQ
tara:strand:+ start:770 stop:1258 length:489 start_codon:yes stop_codon:yes gene_type:complete